MGQVLLLGLISGGIYALFAVAVVLVYRGTGVLSFAQGEIGTVSLFVAALFSTTWHLPWLVGAVAAVVAAAAMGVGFERLIVRPMTERGGGGIGASVGDKVAISVATVGLTLFLVSAELVFIGESPQRLAPPVMGGIRIDRVVLSWTELAALVIALGLGFGLQAVLRRTDFGLGILAAAQDPAAVRLVGVPLSRISATLWGAGAAVSAVAALLIEPTIGLFAPGYATELYVLGLAAACIGGLSSLPGAFVGGIVLGVASALAQKLFGQTGVSGLQYLSMGAILLVTLLGRSVWPELRSLLAVAGPAGTPVEVSG